MSLLVEEVDTDTPVGKGAGKVQFTDGADGFKIISRQLFGNRNAFRIIQRMLIEVMQLSIHPDADRRAVY